MLSMSIKLLRPIKVDPDIERKMSDNIVQKRFEDVEEIKYFIGINFRDRTKFWRNSLFLMPFLVIFDRYFDNSHESYISRV